ncbi:MAG: arsenical pump rane protein [Pseudonocardiales bacterium]|nr:arsenical pump rane protein [Pseudonocardiales bacterium]
MHGAAAETLAIVLLALTLAVAVLRPRGLSEAVVAVPAALVLVASGVVPLDAATQRLREIGPTVGFLAAILVFGHLCAEAGVFDYLGSLAARASHGSAPRLLVLVVVIAAAVTAVLTLDATVVLLTPVVLTTAARLGVSARPYAYACTRLANSASLLLPVSNLTNLLAFTASGLSFGRFAALMVLPWLVACAAEWLGLRLFFRRDLADSVATPAQDRPPAPRFALTVLAVTVAGFVVTSTLHIAPAWAAVAGCVALLVPRAVRRDVHPMRVVGEASPGFCVFVLALAVIVDAVTRHGLATELGRLVPSGTQLPALLLLAGLAAVLANLVNNLPATLALIPLVAGSPAAVLAVLLGVNIGPNLTYAGSLATLLWRRLLPERDRPRAAEFHTLGALTVPPILLLATVSLWAALRVVGV